MKSHSVLGFLLVGVAVLPAVAQGQDAASKITAQTPISTPIVYQSTKYGFCFRLPADWKGYTVITGKWSGSSPGTGKEMQGPLLLIRHPAWTEDDPYQDIPIMIFTQDQWRDKEAHGLITSTFGADWGTFGSNAKYVFKQPDRWVGYTDDKGWREVEDLMMTHPFQAPCSKSRASAAK